MVQVKSDSRRDLIKCLHHGCQWEKGNKNMCSALHGSLNCWTPHIHVFLAVSHMEVGRARVKMSLRRRFVFHSWTLMMSAHPQWVLVVRINLHFNYSQWKCSIMFPRIIATYCNMEGNGKHKDNESFHNSFLFVRMPNNTEILTFPNSSLLLFRVELELRCSAQEKTIQLQTWCTDIFWPDKTKSLQPAALWGHIQAHLWSVLIANVSILTGSCLAGNFTIFTFFNLEC